MEEPKDRLKAARTQAGYSTGSEAARAFGWPISTYLGHENGDRKFNLDAAKKYARAFHVRWEWIIEGGELTYQGYVEKRERTAEIPLVGVVSTGGYLQTDVSEYYGIGNVVVEVPVDTGYELVSVEIVGGLSPKYDIGDVIVIRPGYTEVANFVGKWVLAETEEGIWYFRQLDISTRYRDKFNLLAPNAPAITDVGITQVGSVYMILPQAQIGPPRGAIDRRRTFGDPRDP